MITVTHAVVDRNVEERRKKSDVVVKLLPLLDVSPQPHLMKEGKLILCFLAMHIHFHSPFP